MSALSRPMQGWLLLLVAGGFFGITALGLLVPLYTGFFGFILVRMISARVARRLGASYAHTLAATFIAAGVTLLISLLFVALYFALRYGDSVALLARIGDVLISARAWLPESLAAKLPEQPLLFDTIASWLKQHSAEVSVAGFGALKVFGYALLGLLIGVMTAISTHSTPLRHGPIGYALAQQVAALRQSFAHVFGAQFSISGINTFFTGIFLLVVLPLAGVQMPFAKTLVLLTFIVGLLPIVGNLVSNSAITLVGIGVSFPVGMASLAFLIVIHKLEYFINARIVGARIKARAWELLITMLVMERLFGVVGLIAAPVFYAWAKAQWRIFDAATPVSVQDQMLNK